MKNEGMKKFVTVLAKVLEVFHWVGSALTALGVFFIAIGRLDALRFVTDANETMPEISDGVFFVDLTGLSQEQVRTVFLVFFVALLFTMILTATIFRNIYLVFKTAAGETKFSKGRTPFQPDIVRMIREIGIFAIACPVIDMIASIVLQIAIGDALEASVSFSGVVFGLVILCLSEFFQYGAKLQEENDGLL